MYWENIDGYFNFENIYEEMASKHDVATFVEIGTWKGRSAVFMGEQLKGKNISFYTIDPFILSEDSELFPPFGGESFYGEAVANIRPVEEWVTIIKGSSHDTPPMFQDESIDFLFIDGGHDYECVKKDLELWYPKIKKGGTIGGHDYTQPTCGVKQAVDEFFSSPVTVNGTSWLFIKRKKP